LDESGSSGRSEIADTERVSHDRTEHPDLRIPDDEEADEWMIPTEFPDVPPT
jgi:hypothetical protein